MTYDIMDQLFQDYDHLNSINRDNLRQILRDNASTDYGRKYGFGEIFSIEEFREKVPLSDYSAYEKTGTVSAYPCAYILHTSGTTGKTKTIYLTEESLRRYSGYVYLMPMYLAGIEPEYLIHVNMFRIHPEESILTEACFNYFFEEGFAKYDSFAGGKNCMFCNEKVDVPYVKLWASLACEKLQMIQSTFLYDVLLMMNYLEKNWEILLWDMEHGQISVPLPEQIRKTLLAMEITPERISFLRSEFQKGFDECIIKRIWKNIKAISGVTGRMFSAYNCAIQRYIGDIPIHYYGYAQSECLAALSAELGTATYTLLPRVAFFEFLDMDTGVVYLPEEIEIGRFYQLVITTFSGVYRYMSGDIVKIVGFTGQSPKFEVYGRVENLLNIDGEKINEQIINSVVQKLVEQHHIHLTTYYVGIDHSTMPSRYALLLDTMNGEEIDCRKIAADFDRFLEKENWDYKDLRSQHLIGEALCIPVNREEISATQKGQAKPGIIMPEATIKQILKNHSI